MNSKKLLAISLMLKQATTDLGDTAPSFSQDEVTSMFDPGPVQPLDKAPAPIKPVVAEPIQTPVPVKPVTPVAPVVPVTPPVVAAQPTQPAQTSAPVAAAPPVVAPVPAVPKQIDFNKTLDAMSAMAGPNFKLTDENRPYVEEAIRQSEAAVQYAEKHPELAPKDNLVWKVAQSKLPTFLGGGTTLTPDEQMAVDFNARQVGTQLTPAQVDWLSNPDNQAKLAHFKGLDESKKNIERYKAILAGQKPKDADWSDGIKQFFSDYWKPLLGIGVGGAILVAMLALMRSGNAGASAGQPQGKREFRYSDLI